MRVAMFVFNPDPMCFIHVLLNGLDMQARGGTVRIVLEGAATTVLPEVAKAGHPLHHLFMEAKAAGLFDGACRACATKLGVAEAVQAAGIALIGEMHGHPAMGKYLEDGYTLITL